MERELAKLKGVDVMIDDHGIMIMGGTFYYESGCCQGFGYCIDMDFVRLLMEVFEANELKEVNGKSCWVTHDASSIIKIEPLHKGDGKTFDIKKWSEDCKKKWLKKEKP